MTTPTANPNTCGATGSLLWCPDRCPITWLPFFMWIQHPTKGMVPTYGGPFDSYTIPEPELPDDENAKVLRHEVEFSRERYDHDEGGWVEGCETVGLRVVTDDYLIELEDIAANNGSTRDGG